MNPVNADIARIGDVLEEALSRRSPPKRRRRAVRLVPVTMLLALALGAVAVASPSARDLVDGGIARLLRRDVGRGAPRAAVPAWIADARAGHLDTASGRELARDGDQRVVAYRDSERGWCVSYGDAAVDCDATPDLARFRRELAQDGMIVRGPYDGAPRAPVQLDRIARAPGSIIYVLVTPDVARIRVRYADRRPIERAVPTGAAVVRTRGARAIAVDALDAAGQVVASRAIPTWEPFPAGRRLAPREALSVLRRPQGAGDRRDLPLLRDVARNYAQDRPADAPGRVDPDSARSVEVGGGVVSMALMPRGALVVLHRDAREREGSATVVVDLPAQRPWGLSYGWTGQTRRSDVVISGVVADEVVRLVFRLGLDHVEATIRDNAVYLRIPADGLAARFPDDVTATLEDGTTVTGLI